MGNRRMGLGRMEALLEQVDRDLNLENTTLTNCTITTNVAGTFGAASAVSGALVVIGGTANQNNLLTGAGTANNTSLEYGSSVFGMTPNDHGSGITDGAINTFIDKIGGIIYTTILIDLHEGLASGGTANDVIGTDGGTANAYIAELTSAVNGVPFNVEMWCTETPTGGSDDIDIICSATATDAENAAVTTGTTVVNGGDWTLGLYAQNDAGATLAALTKKYLYLTDGTGTEAAYTAGKIGIRISGMAIDKDG
jgi:hypothetical protein